MPGRPCRNSDRLRQRHALRVPGVPCVFREANFEDRGFVGKRGQWRAGGFGHGQRLQCGWMGGELVRRCGLTPVSLIPLALRITTKLKTPFQQENQWDRLHLINVFVAVVDASGFAGAARKLGISPPAVTLAINALETQLGVRLLTRTTRVVRVTEPGARYAEDCRRILGELAEAGESVTGMHGAPRGRLTLRAPVLFGAIIFTPS
jgi:hypothetical protein